MMAIACAVFNLGLIHLCIENILGVDFCVRLLGKVDGTLVAGYNLLALQQMLFCRQEV